MDSDRYISMKDAALVLEVSTSTVRRYYDEGLLLGGRTAKGHRRILRTSVSDLREKLIQKESPGIIFHNNRR